MGKIYTSRYSNKNLSDTDAVKIAVSLGRPRFKIGYEIAQTIKEFTPAGIFGIEDKAIFQKLYNQRLDKLGKHRAMEILKSAGYASDKDVILLCFEDVTKPNDWCHRTMLAEWIEKNLGIVVAEYPDNNTFAEAEKKKSEKKKEENTVEDKTDEYWEEQLRLF